MNLPEGPKDHETVNTGFDKLHKQGRMKWSGFTLLTYSCIVGWTTKVDGMRKRRTVVDIRLRNWIMLLDAYPMLSQANILAGRKKATEIPTINCPAFFHQSKLKLGQKNILKTNRIPRALVGGPRNVRGNARKESGGRDLCHNAN